MRAPDYQIFCSRAGPAVGHAATLWAAPVARARTAERTAMPEATCAGIREESERTTSPEISKPRLTGPGCMMRPPLFRCRCATP